MGVPGTNIGQARVRVEFLNRSPFDPRPRQERVIKFTPDYIQAMDPLESSKIYFVPDPITSIRLLESCENYDNYIKDGKKYLEEATYTNDGKSVPIDDNALIRANRKKLEWEKRKIKIDDKQKQFFTWQVSNSIFVPGSVATTNTDSATNSGTINPPALSFEESMLNDGAPQWTYIIKEKPDSSLNPNPLCPFMKKSSPSPQKPIHWGCSTLSALSLNQPFEISFFHEGQVHTIATEAEELTPKYPFLSDFKLTKKAYLIIEIGISSRHWGLLLFVQGSNPSYFKLQQGKDKSITCDNPITFTQFSGEKLFNPENTNFTVKIEAIGWHLMVTSNQFDGKTWVIPGTPNNVNAIGAGQIAIYSGNVQAGFLMRPIQYVERAEVSCPKVFFSKYDEKTSESVICTPSLKGGGLIPQIQNKNEKGDSTIYMVDSEEVNRKAIKNMFQIATGETETKGNNGSRNINVSADPEEENSVDQSGQDDSPPATGPAAKTTSNLVLIPKITLEAAKMVQGNGFEVPNGRSPYIWLLRIEIPEGDASASQSVAKDVTCDVIGVDLQWNSTSLNELTHNGSIRLLSGSKTQSEDYRSYLDKTTYVRIYGWWENGAGIKTEEPLFEGLIVEAKIEKKAERQTVVFRIEDYMQPLEAAKFINSPVYDGAFATFVVRDVLKMIGLPEERMYAGSQKLKDVKDPRGFGLGSETNIQDNQMFKFKDSESLKSAIIKVASIDGKTVFFDNEGNFHYDDIPGGLFGDGGSPKAKFYTSPREAPDGAHIVWNAYTETRKLADVYTGIRVSTIEASVSGGADSGSPIHVEDANISGQKDPNSTGYLGYLKLLVVKDAIFKTKEQANLYLARLRSRVYIPPLIGSFETFGYPGLKPLDTVSVDGQLLRIINISTKMEAPHNFWTSIEGEWLFSSGKDQNSNLTE